ncbi:MAG: glutathione S-transferase [Hyphomicrobiaceae bacterium]|nr:glutathione S-transferase [Hyphomicrobiaceae bacterium]
MKLFHSPTSPYVRKVMVTAIEKGLDGQIEKMPTSASPIKREGDLPSKNPLGKVPCLITDDGRALFDSPVICAYLDSLKSPPLIPADSKGRFDCMTLEALADGFLDAGLLMRYEGTLRPEAKRWDDWTSGQMAKINGALDALETTYASQLAGPLTIGQIAVGCALGWFDFRYGHVDWRSSRPKVAAFAKALSERPSMKSTVPVA